ncbi:MAG: helix-turn-helix transcriptional regulator [Elusimicrobia bacterium]|nr:helix-turn-helix transcriptional regulator [Elusimicrobiota bacterium]
MNNSKRLKDFLKKKKISLNQGSRLLNIDKYSLWRYTSGKREPSKEIRILMKKKLEFEWLEVK